MRERVIVSLFLFLLMLSIISPAWAVQYQAIDLGPIGQFTYDFEINNSGQIVGTSSSQSAAAVIWNRDGSVTNLGNFTPEGINNTGKVVGRRGQYACFYSQSSGLIDLSCLQGGNSSAARVINDDGWITGWSNDSANMRHAVLWDENHQIIDLGTLNGYKQSEAYAVNDLGWVVGVSSNPVNPNDYYRLTVWKPVPEPSSLFTLACGLSAVLLRKRR